jgi:hypothetical protein
MADVTKWGTFSTPSAAAGSFCFVSMARKAGGDPGRTDTSLSSRLQPQVKKRDITLYQLQTPPNPLQINTANMVKAGTYCNISFLFTGPLGAEGLGVSMFEGDD